MECWLFGQRDLPASAMVRHCIFGTNFFHDFVTIYSPANSKNSWKILNWILSGGKEHEDAALNGDNIMALDQHMLTERSVSS